MKIRFALPLLLSLCGFPVLGSGSEPVAVVYSIDGNGAWMQAPEAKSPVVIELFSWLREGTVLSAPTKGRLLLCFQSGARYQLGPRARATLSQSSLEKTSGEVKTLPAAPPLPRTGSVASGTGSQPEAAAPAALTGSLRDAESGGNGSVLAETAALEWPAMAGANRYLVTIDAADGRTVYQTETTASTLRVPSSLLEPGARYSWRVSAVTQVGVGPRSETVIQVLPADVAKARKAFQQALRLEGGPDALALISEVDRSLGLYAEARTELREAIGLIPREHRTTSRLGQLKVNKGAELLHPPTPIPQ